MVQRTLPCSPKMGCPSGPSDYIFYGIIYLVIYIYSLHLQWKLSLAFTSPASCTRGPDLLRLQGYVLLSAIKGARVACWG